MTQPLLTLVSALPLSSLDCSHSGLLVSPGIVLFPSLSACRRTSPLPGACSLSSSFDRSCSWLQASSLPSVCLCHPNVLSQPPAPMPPQPLDGLLGLIIVISFCQTLSFLETELMSLWTLLSQHRGQSLRHYVLGHQQTAVE